jgi:hypothetical protein
MKRQNGGTSVSFAWSLRTLVSVGVRVGGQSVCNVFVTDIPTDKNQAPLPTFTLDIPNVEALSRILALSDQIPYVTEVRHRTRG